MAEISKAREQFDEAFIKLALAQYLEMVGEEYLAKPEPEIEVPEEMKTRFYKQLDEAFAAREKAARDEIRRQALELERLDMQEEAVRPKPKRMRRTVVRVAAVAAVVAITMCTVVFSVSSFRVPLMEFFTKDKDTYTSVQIGSGDDAKLLATYEGDFRPTWLPDGYRVHKVDNDVRPLRITCMAETGIIMFEEFHDATILYNDSENAKKSSEVDINGTKGWMITKDGRYSIFWEAELSNGTSHGINITTNDKNVDLLKLAHCVEEIKK